MSPYKYLWSILSSFMYFQPVWMHTHAHLKPLKIVCVNFVFCDRKVKKTTNNDISIWQHLILLLNFISRLKNFTQCHYQVNLTILLENMYFR